VGASRKTSSSGASLALEAPGFRFGALRRALGVASWLAGGALLAIAQPVMADCSLPVGDINGDGKTNVADSQCIVLSALFSVSGGVGAPPACLGGGSLANSDFNCDGSVNISDAQLHVQVVLQNPLLAAIDSDGNFCPDSCQTPVLGGPPVVVPTYFYGTASGGGLTVRPLAPGSTATGASAGGGLVVQPKAVGATGQ
jgi:hypothetical protein